MNVQLMVLISNYNNIENAYRLSTLIKMKLSKIKYNYFETYFLGFLFNRTKSLCRRHTSFVSEPHAIYPSATDKPTKFCASVSSLDVS